VTVDLNRLRAAYEKVRDELLAERTSDGHWVGELSSSALSTATAVSALSVVRRAVQSPKCEVQGQDVDSSATLDLGRWTLDSLDDLIQRGAAWLVQQQNADGGFGDTDLSYSNIATTYLVVAALHLAKSAVGNALCGVPGCGEASLQSLLGRATAYIDAKGRLNGLRERYGIDKTFVVPIMTNLALAGLVDWREIDPLPFELACVPQSWYRFVGMPVVSYAIPALVAIGQARFFHAPPRNPLTRLLRRLSVSRSLKILRQMQPDSGGYLEATPLTSFVVMSLAAVQSGPLAPRADKSGVNSRRAGRHRTDPPSAPGNSRSELPTFANEVIREGVKFLVNSARPDGSWPIDTNLATWNTTLAINALAGAGEDVAELLGPPCLDWLLSCQHTKRHAFTGADPGGFGWSDLSGAVPDADDTPGALLALHAFHRNAVYMEPVAEYFAAPRSRSVHAMRWLLHLQNRDGGWPTFCRGWGKLPFDRSGTDLTSHVLRARHAWDEVFGDENVRYRLTPGAKDHMIFPWESNFHAHRKGLSFLRKRQHPDGSWSPLWFGNQDHPSEENPVYGTAKVLMAYRDLGLMDSPQAQRGVAWLVANQNADGGWGNGVWVRRSDKPVLRTPYSVLGTPERPYPPQDNPKSKIQILKSSIEETALAVEALLAACSSSPQPPAPSPATAAVAHGLSWLLDRVEEDQHRQPAPIGFYFAKLWYYERLYPLIFAVAALGRAYRQFDSRQLAPPTTADPAVQPSEIRAP
jgi:squalene-hopene/tetraprenyl-beta-curcumene cyclase